MVKRQLNVRIPDEWYERVEQDEKPTVDIVIDALKLYYEGVLSQASTGDSNNDSTPDSKAILEIESLKTELAHKNEIIRIREESIRDLQLQTGFLISEFQKLTGMYEKSLMPAPVEIKKKWWEVWKK